MRNRKLQITQRLGQSIAQKIALYYRVDDAIRAAQTPILTSGTVSPMDFIEASEAFTISDPFCTLLADILPVDTSGIGKAALSKIGSDKFTFQRALDHIGQQLKDFTTIDIIESQLGKPDEGANGAKGSGRMNLSQNGKELLAQLWEDNNVVGLTLAARAVVESMTNKANAISITSFIGEAMPWLDIQKFFNENFTSLHITDGSTVSSVKIGQQTFGKWIKGTEFIVAAQSPSIFTFSFEDLLMAGGDTVTGKRGAGLKGGFTKAADRTEQINVLYRHLTSLEAMHAVDSVAKYINDNHKISDTSNEFSDIKELNQVIIELQRQRKMIALRMFVTLQAWVLLVQKCIATFHTEDNYQDFEERNPALASTFDVKDLITRFNALKVGKASSDLVSDISICTEATFRGTSWPIAVLTRDYADATSAPDLINGYYKLMIAKLDPFLKNKEMIDLYNEGAAILHGVSHATVKVTRNLDAIPVNFSQFGRTAGDRVTTFSDCDWAVKLGWGINRFNSSAKTAIIVNGVNDDEFVEQLSYGKIDYPQYVKQLIGKMATISGSETAAKALATLNIPSFAVHRRCLKGTILRAYIDTRLSKMGSAALLPLPPESMIPLKKEGVQVSALDKQVVGVYETRLDGLPMTFNHVPPNEGDAGDVSDSLLDLVSNTHLKVIKSAVANENNMLRRFVMDKEPSKLSSATASEDSFFEESMAYVYVIPNQCVDLHINAVSMIHPLLSQGSADTRQVMWKEVSIVRYLTGTDNLVTQTATGRLSGSITAMDGPKTLPMSEDYDYLTKAMS